MPAKLESVRILFPLICFLPWAGLPPLLLQGQPALTPQEAQAMAQRALATELRTAQDPNHPMRYKLRKTSPRLTSTKLIVETRDGDVARLVSINDQPLSPPDEQKEQARLDTLLSDPSLQRHRKHSEDSDTEIVLKLLRMLPNAFFYQYAGSGDGPTGKVEKFTFQPNPHFSPPDIETRALTSMTGQLWIDAGQERVTRLEGHLRQDTDLAWGILGKLNKGGSVVIEQADVGGHHWRITRFKMVMTLRLLFTTKNTDTAEEMTLYTPVPAGMDYRQAIQMLRATPGTTSQTGR